jgi:hypothetical protein
MLALTLIASRRSHNDWSVETGFTDLELSAHFTSLPVNPNPSRQTEDKRLGA